MTAVTIPRRELEWLMDCSEIQMGDGDTARAIAERWLDGRSAIDIINAQQRRMGYQELSADDSSRI
ncbi:hypothetical protein B447_04953 [Thauera sp. 27]|uniref:hypothetical protein n=1 Tax=Thauera sp. 27 TaxID=305700 RepID=UPI0002CE8EA3|nr:hypothetical protein [Thauera sp. 27]ENO82058.1 hypothetical protein B447_04953 [Thauera sp. 27]